MFGTLSVGESFRGRVVVAFGCSAEQVAKPRQSGDSTRALESMNHYGGVPRHDNDINKLDGVDIHDGIPRQFFNQTWRRYFIRALGGKTQDGFTMDMVLFGTHMGGPFWVGPAMNADQQRMHNMRLYRLMCGGWVSTWMTYLWLTAVRNQ